MDERCDHEVIDMHGAMLRCVALAPFKIRRDRTVSAHQPDAFRYIYACRRHVSTLVRSGDVIGTVS